MNKTLYVGLDVHADTIAVAVAEEGRNGEVRFWHHREHGRFRLAACQTADGAGQVPTFCYAAGPCGYGLYRHLVRLGLECAVVVPAMIPRKAGDRIKTDRRDAEMLARLWRAGELTPIWTPDEEQEAMRDLIRTRKQALDALKVAKQRLLSFPRRYGLRYQNGSYWTKRHRRWLAELRRFRFPHQQLAFEELKRAIDQIEARVATLDQAIEDAVQHLGDFISACTFGRRLKILKGLTPYEYICKSGFRARKIHPKPDPPYAGTEHPVHRINPRHGG